MKNYLRKTLMIYISLATILVGMAGVSYAITASEADEYVTRAEFTVKMESVRDKLNEKEIKLLGEINKYRSTHVKFTTFDSPNRQYTASNARGGYYNGGNMFPRLRLNNEWYYGSLGWAADINGKSDGQYRHLNLFRLWNGNYYITNEISAKTSLESGTGTQYFGMRKCAVPVENYPGWYMTLITYSSYGNYIRWWGSLVKLDPNVPMPSNNELMRMRDGWITLRFKKELWTYISPTLTTKITKNKFTTNITTYHYTNMSEGFLADSYRSDLSPNSNTTMNYTTWLDETTGDYMCSIQYVRPVSAYYGEDVYVFNSANIGLCRLVPVDNVEYLMGSIIYDGSGSGRTSTSYASIYPDPRYIGTGLYNDPYYEYEIVDCENGIKYWHVRKKPTKYLISGAAATVPTTLALNYAIPIVY